MRLSSIFGSLGDCVFLCGDSDGVRRNVEDAENGRRGERSRRRDVSTFLREPLGLAAFSAGSTLGAARPQTCAKESSTLWTLFRGRPSAKVRFTRRDYVCVNTYPRKKRYRSNHCTHACKTRVQGKTRPALIYGRAGRAVLRCCLHAQASRLEPPPSGEESGCVREAERKQALPVSG